MAKIKLNPIFVGLSGAMGDVVFRRSNKSGEAIVARRTRNSNPKPSAAQLAQRERFAKASAYAKAALADPELRARYEALATSEKTPYAVAVADYLTNIDPQPRRAEGQRSSAP